MNKLPTALVISGLEHAEAMLNTDVSSEPAPSSSSTDPEQVGRLAVIRRFDEN